MSTPPLFSLGPRPAAVNAAKRHSLSAPRAGQTTSRAPTRTAWTTAQIEHGCFASFQRKVWETAPCADPKGIQRRNRGEVVARRDSREASPGLRTPSDINPARIARVLNPSDRKVTDPGL